MEANLPYPELPEAHLELAEIKDLCNGQINDIIGILRAGIVEDLGDDEVLADYVHGLVRDAVEANDVVAADLALIDLADLNMELLAEACVEVLPLGSETAKGYIDSLLQIESEMVEKGDIPDAILLSVVVMKCIDCNVLGVPEGLIAKYARHDQAERWQMYTAYYRGMLAAGDDILNADGVGVFSTALNQKCLELLEPGRFSDSEVFQLAPGALFCVQDPAVASELAMRVLSSDVEMPDFLYLSNLAASGLAVMENEAAPAHYLGQLFEQKINGALQRAQGKYPEEMYEHILRKWRMACVKRHGASPEEQLATLYAEFARITHDATGDAEAFDEYDGSRGAIRYMDQEIISYALSYALKEDFAAARVFLSGVTNSAFQTAAFQRCLDYATTSSELHDLTSELDVFRMNPDLQVNTAILDASLKKDAAQLASLALDIAYSIQIGPFDGANSLREASVGNAFQLFSELLPEQAPVLAKQLLEIMRLRGQGGAKTYYLSGAAIRAGDSDEALEVYEEICSDIPDSEKQYRLPRLAALARDLA